MSKINTLQTILFVHSSDEMYGADLVLLQLIEGLDSRLFRPIVVVPTDVDYEGLLTQALRVRGIATVHMKTAILRRRYFTVLGIFRYLYRFLLSTALLIALIRRERVNVVHSNTLSVIPGAFAAWFTRRPHVWHVHEIILTPRFLWKVTAWLVANMSSAAVAVSGPTRDHLCNGHARNSDKTIVIYNGLDPSPFDGQEDRAKQIRSDWGVLPDQILVGMVGRVSSWKGQDYFLDVAHLIVPEYPETRFALVGGSFPGNENLTEKLHCMVRDMGMLNYVIMDGFRDDIPAIMHAFDIFVLPSTLPDPLPTVVLETMAAGRPVVANAHGGSIEMVDHQVTGFLVPPNNKQSMANAITRLIIDASLRQRLGRQGRERLERLFSYEVFVQKWQDLYLEMIRANRV